MSDEYEEEEPFEPIEGERSKRWSEGVLREAFRKAVEKGVEAGVGTLSKADSALRGVTQDGKLPKEVIGYVFSQVDETKNALVRGVANEVRDFLEATDIAQEFYRALTTLSFEVKTEIRFIPNDSGGVRPQVKAAAVQKRKPKKSTGTSYLPEETVARAEEGSKFEKIKLGKDTTAMFTDLYEYAAKIRAGEMTWQDVEDADINTRLKWTGAPLLR